MVYKSCGDYNSTRTAITVVIGVLHYDRIYHHHQQSTPLHQIAQRTIHLHTIKKFQTKSTMKYLTIDPSHAQPATRDLPTGATVPDSLPDPKATKFHPTNAGGENAQLLFVGTATTILYVCHRNRRERKIKMQEEWRSEDRGIRMCTY